jgi:molecular chaperone DnaJ
VFLIWCGLGKKKHHNMNKEPLAEDAFKKIAEAYKVLNDDNKGSVYDEYGEAEECL